MLCTSLYDSLQTLPLHQLYTKVNLCASIYSSYLMEKVVPLKDRQAAMCLLLELTLQRGTLSHILEGLLLLLRLSYLIPSTDKNRRACKVDKEGVKGDPQGMEQSADEEELFPLVLFLRRLASIPISVPNNPHLKAGQETQVGVALLWSAIVRCHYACSSIDLHHVQELLGVSHLT